MIIKPGISRITSNSFGLIAQILSLFMLVRLLDIYQFGLWGIANSIIYILSGISQLSYSQYIEKYFPNIDDVKRKSLFYSFFKTILFTLPINLLIVSSMVYFGYFDKFNANNLFILSGIIVLQIITEALVNLYNHYFISKNISSKFDLNELFLFKIPRVIIFFILLINGYSVFYILAFQFFLRFIFLINLVKADLKKINLLFNFLNLTSISKNKFPGIKYNFIAYLDKTLYISFVNFLFLISSNFIESIAISYFSLGILIINNLRPVFDSIPSLLPRTISSNLNKNDNSFNIQYLSMYSSGIFISIVIFTTDKLLNIKFFNFYILENYSLGIEKVIFLSIFASGLHSFYLPKYYEILFSGYEKTVLRFNIINYFLSSSLLIFFNYKFNVENFIYFYIVYEFFNTLFIFYINNFKLSRKDLTFKKLILVVPKIFYVAFAIFLYNLTTVNPPLVLQVAFVVLFLLDIKSFLKKINL